MAFPRSSWPSPENTQRYRPGFASRVLRFAIPAGAIVAATTFAAYLQARAVGLPLAQQRTTATVVTLTLSVAVLTLLPVPLTWRRFILVSAALTGFALLFPVAAIGSFYALDLPGSQLAATLSITVLGLAALTLFWALFHIHGTGDAPI